MIKEQGDFNAKYKGQCFWCTNTIEIGERCSIRQKQIMHDSKDKPCRKEYQDDKYGETNGR